MKHLFRPVLCMLAVICTFTAFTQVTRLSNNTDIQYGVQANGKFILSDLIGNLWTTNGTAAGTSIYTTKVLYDSSGGFGLFNDKVFFSGFTIANGIELWVSDGTDAGTSLIKNIASGAANSTPGDFYVFNNILFFTADDGINGRELWKTDGTAGGTVLVKNIDGAATSSIDFPSFFSNINTLFFAANDGTNGIELWKTDGSAAGTVLVKDVTPGSTDSQLMDFVALGTKTLFFNMVGGYITGEMELWSSDGTTAGTTLVKNFGSFSAFPSFGSFVFNNKLIFSGTNTTKGTELWSSDGTTAGTAILKDINNGVNGSYPILFNAIIINGKFYFNATTGSANSELWECDGTGAGTVLLKDINPGSNGSIPFILPDISQYGADGIFNRTQLYNGKIFLMADNGTNGNELWITDGTAVNTTMVKDILAGGGDGFGGIYFYTNAGLYFSADDGSNGAELWKSDGTTGGTTLVKDVYAGVNGSDIIFIGIYNGHLYFTADDGDGSGARDLYIVDQSLGTLPLNLLNLTASAGNDAVLLNWTTSNEVNSSRFVIERSTNGINFQSLGSVNAKGNDARTHTYSFNDAGVLKAGAATLYYRLQIVDKDGAFAYSKIVPVTLKPYAGLLKAYPNPVKDQLFVLFNIQHTTKAQLRISDASGKIVYSQLLNTAQNNSAISINVSALSKGIYHVQLITDKGVQQTQFMKQ